MAELGEKTGRCGDPLEAPSKRRWVGILFIRLKISNRWFRAVKSFLLTHSTRILSPLREIMVRLLLEMGPHGIVAEHPGKPFLLA
jgi:hypothetical protein